MKRIGLTISIAVISISLFYAARWFVYKPNLDKIRLDNTYEESEISYRRNYRELIQIDELNNRDFLINEAVKAIIYKTEFPFGSKELDIEHTKKLISILNDSSTYRWIEWGTPEYSKIIVFEDKDGNKIGFTKWQSLGETDSYPYRSVMKWGGLSKMGFKKINDIIK